MGTSSVLKQMAEYDFTVPTDVTIIYEDNELSLQDNTEDQENLEDGINIKETFIDDGIALVEECDSENITNLGSDINDSQINTPILEEISKLNNTENILNNNNCTHAQLNKNHIEAGHLENENKTNGNSDLLPSSETTANKEDSLSIETELNNHEPINTQIEDMLNKVSELLTFVLHTHYLYTLTKNTPDVEESRKKFIATKAHYFNLSFKIVESTIIPQENNNDFIEKFIDNTVKIANRKSYPWKCQKFHMKSLLLHLIKWTKQKRIHLDNNRTPSLSNEYVTLKEQLARPLKPVNIPQCKTVPNNSHSNNENDPSNNICIFSSGTPGGEVSININAETFRNFNKNECSSEQTNENHASHLTNPEPPTTNRPLVRPAPPQAPPPPYEQHLRYQDNYLPSRHPSPQHNPYNASQTFLNGPQYQNQAYMQAPRTQNYNDTRGVHRGCQQQNPQVQVQHINSSQMNNNRNSHYTYYDNMNKQMYERQVHARNHNPVSGHAYSFNPPPPPFVRCYMCGKYIISRHSPYNGPNLCSVPYCSQLCKEMHAQHYKPASAWARNA